MSALTPRAGLYKAGGGLSGLNGADETADIDKAVNDNLDKIDGLLGLKKVTSTSRPVSPMDGQIIYETDTKVTRYWNSSGASWDRLVAPVGVVPITPASLVGSAGGTQTINADGSISFTGCTVLVVNGVFNSDFKSYEIEYELESTTSAAGLVLRMVLATVPQTGTLYYYHTSYGLGSSHFDADASANTYFLVNDVVSTNAGFGKTRVMSPALPKLTQVITEWSHINTAGTALGNGLITGWHNTSTSYDGFSMLPSVAGSMTGTVRVRGLA